MRCRHYARALSAFGEKFFLGQSVLSNRYRRSRWSNKSLLCQRRQTVRGNVFELGGDGLALCAHARQCRRIGVSSTDQIIRRMTSDLQLPVEVVGAPTADPSAHGERDGFVFYGTSVVSGIGRAEVVATGADTMYGLIARRLLELAPTPQALLDLPPETLLELMGQGGKFAHGMAVAAAVAADQHPHRSALHTLQGVHGAGIGLLRERHGTVRLARP